MEKIRNKIYWLREEISKEVLRDHSDYEDDHRMEQLRTRWKLHIDAIKKDDKDQYIQFLSYLCFFENLGLMVRRSYVPLRDIIQMYKGPILDVGIMFTLHIKDGVYPFTASTAIPILHVWKGVSHAIHLQAVQSRISRRRCVPR